MDFHSLAGDKKTYREELKQTATDWGLDETELTFMSEFEPAYSSGAPNSAVREMLSLSNLFVMPSKSESYSYVTQEAGIMGNLLVLNHDFPPFWDIYGKNALYFQFSSNMDKMSWKDGDTNTTFSDITQETKPDRFPEANIYRVNGQWAIKGDAAYADSIAKRIRHVFNNNLVLGQRQERMRSRNLFHVFRNHLEPLLFANF